MMVGNPSNRSWSMLNNLNMHQQQQHNLPPNSASSPPSQLLIPNNNTTSTSTSTSSHPNNLMLNHFPGHDQQHQHDQQLISSNHSPWSNLLLRGGLSTREEDEEEEEEDKDAESDDHQVQYQELCLASNISTNYPSFLHPSSVLPNLMIKPEVISLNNPHNHPETNSLLFLMYANNNNHQYDHVLPPQPTTLLPPSSSSSHQVIRASSCRNLNTTTTTSSNSKSMLDFSAHRPVDPHDRSISSECNSRAKTGGVEHNYNNNKKKKARVHHHHDQQQASSSQPFLKVRKEKLGDRITALHQLVSPFGKTDTASVLLEAIGCIRFLQAQIEALSSPYAAAAAAAAAALPPSSNSNITAQQHGSDCQEVMGPSRDLRSRGLCLVPVTCTQHVGGGGGNEGVGTVDYNWAPAIGGGF